MNAVSGKGAIIGGVAVAILARARTTADVDATVFPRSESIHDRFGLAAKHELTPRQEKAEQFAKANRVMLLEHAPTGIPVDISLGGLPFEDQMIRRAQLHLIGTSEVPVATPEDLIVTKGMARRPSDLLDIDLLVRLNPGLNKEMILSELSQFAQALEMPEIVDEVRRIMG
jgi:hypothetical protein